MCGLKIELVPAAERLFIDKTQRVKNARSLHPSPNPHGLVDTVQRSSGKDLLALSKPTQPLQQSSFAVNESPWALEWQSVNMTEHLKPHFHIVQSPLCPG